MNRQPNIVMICSDQHTARVMGCQGDPVVETPNLDALAADGCRFDSFYCNNPICVPSRMSFMSGRYPFKCDCIGNQSVLDSRYPTMAHIAVRAGYHAVLAGKMHFNGPDQRHGFLERPIGEMSTQALYNGADRPPRTGLALGDLGNCSRPDPLLHTGPGRNPYVEYDAAVTDRTVAWLDRYAGIDAAPPFFLMAGYLLPHCPYIAPPELYGKYEGRVRVATVSAEEMAALHPHHREYREGILLGEIPAENQERATAAYYALTDQLDRNVGRLIAALRRNGLWENTVVFYFSDHGEMLGRHGRWHKESFFEDSARVPMIVRVPGMEIAGRSAVHHSLVDLMPTLCELSGVKAPPGLDGVSMLPALRGETPNLAAKVETYTFWSRSRPGLSSNRMVRLGPWKLSYYGAHDSYELFNLEDDPEERKNLADAPGYADVVGELSQQIFADGWSPRAADEVEDRLSRFGHPENMKAYRDALHDGRLKDDPLPLDSPDFWQEGGSLVTAVDPQGKTMASQD